MNSLMAEIVKKTIFQNKIFVNKLLYLIIINLISKIGNGQVVENIFFIGSKIIYFCLRSNFRERTTLIASKSHYP